MTDERGMSADEMRAKLLEGGLAPVEVAALEEALLAVGGAPLGVLLDRVEALIRKYVVITSDQLIALTLWVGHTHAIEYAQATPYVHLTSPVEESGKSRAMEVLALLTRQAVMASSMSAAVLYRLIDQQQPTLFIDEVDNTLRAKDDSKGEILAIINAGYRRGSPVYRMGGANFREVQSFESFSAKAVAGIGSFPATLASRCLRIEMQRRGPDDPVADFYFEEAGFEAGPIREGLASWIEANGHMLPEIRPAKLGVRDRQEESYRPLLVIAEAAGGRWQTEGRAALTALATGSSSEAVSEQALLLSDIREVFVETDETHLATTRLLDALFQVESSPWADRWAEKDRDGQLVPRAGAPSKLARALRPFKIRPRTVRVGELLLKGYTREEFLPAWARNLPPRLPDTPVTPVTPQAPSQAVVPGVPDVSATRRCVRGHQTTPDGAAAGVAYGTCGHELIDINEEGTA